MGIDVTDFGLLYDVNKIGRPKAVTSIDFCHLSWLRDGLMIVYTLDIEQLCLKLQKLYNFVKITDDFRVPFTYSILVGFLMFYKILYPNVHKIK